MVTLEKAALSWNLEEKKGVGWVKEACSWQREQHRRGPEVRDSIAGPRISHGQAEPGVSSGLDRTRPLWVQLKL